MFLPAGLVQRLQDPSLHGKVMGAQEAATLIAVGANVGMSGFTGAAYPKAVPQALAARLAALHATGQTQARIGFVDLDIHRARTRWGVATCPWCRTTTTLSTVCRSS
jgi:acyl-CoA hydrolase